MNKYKLTVFIAIFIIAADQMTKMIVRANLALFEQIPVLPFFNMVHVRNTGAAFGIMNDLPETVRIPLFAVVLVVAVIAIFLFLKSTPGGNVLQVFSLSLILGGAVGNSIDRFRFGYVTDFLDFHWFGNPEYHWPAFNIADSAITVGVILILMETLLLMRSSRVGKDA